MPLLKLENIAPNIQFGVWHINESIDDLSDSLTLSRNEKELFMSFGHEKRKRQWLSCRQILKHLNPSGEIHYSKTGKPRINDGYISISHSEEYASLILNSNSETGIDIQKIDPKVERIRHKFLHPEEEERIPKNDLRQLTLIWSAKEAIYKSIGSERLIFKEHIKIEPPNEANELSAKVTFTAESVIYQLKYEIFDDYCLVYLID